MRFPVAGLAAVVLCGVLASPMEASAGKSDNSIRYATELVPESIDPYFNNVWIGIILAHHVWDTLIFRDPKTHEYKGQLATDWTWVDERTLELNLRRGVKFHNGADFSADDVVYTFNFVSDPANKGLNHQFTSWIERAEKVDQHKVRIIARRPTPAAIEFLAGPLVIHPHEYYSQVGPKGMNDKPVGSGPFRVTAHVPGKHVQLVRNDGYFADSPKPKPKVEKILVRYIPDRQTEIAEALSGGIDLFMNIGPDEAAQLRATSPLQAISGETMRISFFLLNSMEKSPSPPLRDVRVRRAILHAIDRQGMVETIVGKGARVLHTLCFPEQFGCSDAGAPRYGYDPAKAKQLLAEAGYANGFDIDLYAYRERNQMEAIIGYLKAVGIRANLRFMQYAALREAARTGKAGMAQTTWASFSVNDLSASTPVFHKFGPDDISRDPEVRDLLEKGDSSLDPNVRKDVYGKALARIAEEAYSLPLYSLPLHYVAAPDLVFTTYPDSLPRMWEMHYK